MCAYIMNPVILAQRYRVIAVLVLSIGYFCFCFFFCPNHSLCNDVSSDSRGPPMVILPLTVIFTNTAFLPFCSYKAIPNALISGSSRNANLTSSSPTANRILLGRSAL